MSSSIPDDLIQLLLRLGAAALLSGLLGLDRERRHKPLGLRTNILVVLGACSFGLMTLNLVELFRSDHRLGKLPGSGSTQDGASLNLPAPRSAASSPLPPSAI